MPVITGFQTENAFFFPRRRPHQCPGYLMPMLERTAGGLASALAVAVMLCGATETVQAGVLIKGRVLERANLDPVPGASVSLKSLGLSALTDAKGVFNLVSGVSAVRESPPLGEHPTPSGRRASVHIRLYPAGSRGIAGSHDASGRAWPATAGPAAAGGLSKAAAPGSVEVTCAGLLAKQVEAGKDTLDLGDIILDYPARKFDLGVKPIYGAIPLFDGTRAKMDGGWEHWMGTYRKTNGLSPTPLVWKFVADPVDSGMTMQTCCRAQWGDEDLVTKRKFRDFQLHVEFNLIAPRAGTTDPANSGVYLQSLYEIQIKDDYGLATLGNHDMAGILNEVAAPVNLARPKGQWQSYDITFRAARFQTGARSEKARLTLYWNGKLVHRDKETANEHNTGVSSDSLTDVPHGLKLQSEGHDVRFRNVWIKELVLTQPSTDLGF